MTLVTSFPMKERESSVAMIRYLVSVSAWLSGPLTDDLFVLVP